MAIIGFDAEQKLVEGLKLIVTNDELRNHCKGRAAYHRSRASEKELELPKLREVMASLKGQGHQLATVVLTMYKCGYNLDAERPVEKLEADIRDHRNKALVFDWFADHLLAADYILDEGALTRLEILKR